MRPNITLCLVSCLLGGCLSPRPSAPSTFLHLAGRNITESSCRCIDDQVFKHTAEKYAQSAWSSVCKLAPDGSLSRHYKDGFIEGYIDYLDAGGTGEPPAMPPFKYGLHLYQTVEGRQAVRDWFAGFRHGALIAKSSGFRELIIVPLASYPCEPPQISFYLPPNKTNDTQRRDLYSVPPSKPQSEILPAPKSTSDTSVEKPKVRLLLPEPLPIAFQQGGSR